VPRALLVAFALLLAAPAGAQAQLTVPLPRPS